MRGPYKSRPEPGSIADLVLRFRLSPRFRGWGEVTRAKNDKVLSDFMAFNGSMPVAALRRGDMIAMRDSLSATPGAANNWIKVIRGLLAYAVDLEIVQYNVASKIPKLPPTHQGGFRQWREDEIDAFTAFHRPDTTAHLAMALMLYTGAAVSDAVRLGPGNEQDGRISYRRNKTGVAVSVRIALPLATALQFAPRGLTFLQTTYGHPRSSAGLSNQIKHWTTQAGLGAPDERGRYLGCHGLRKAMGRRLAEAGCTPHEIMAILGHEDIKQAMTYSKAYDRSRAADSALDKLDFDQTPKVTRISVRKRTKEG